MYHTEPPTDKTIREWYMNSSRVAACALRNEQAVRAHGLMNNPVLPHTTPFIRFDQHGKTAILPYCEDCGIDDFITMVDTSQWL